MNSRALSILNSIGFNGTIETINLLFKIFLFKLRISSTIKIKRIGIIHLRRNTSDLPVFRQVFLDCEYHFLKNFNDSKIIIDSGANIGMFTRYLNPIFPNSKFICIEPEPNNFECLKKNTKNFNNVFLLQKALWIDNNGVRINIDEKYGEWGATVSNSIKTGKQVDSITMNQLINYFEIVQIDILKINIESAEKFLFQGELGWMQIVKAIVIELHDFINYGSSNNFFKAIETMQPYNFSVIGENILIKRI